MPITYKTYDELASPNRTLCTTKLWHSYSMELPKHRLQAARRNAGYDNPTDAANAIRSINKHTITSHENGNRDISRKAAEKYAAAFGVSAGWILYGDQEEPTAEQDVPLVSWISAGALAGREFDGAIMKMLRISGLPHGEWMALKVRGDSMDRISPPESVILVNLRDKTLVPNGCYVIDDGEGNATYKRYRPGPPPRFEPVSVNVSLEPIFFDNEPLIIGRVRRSILDM